MTCVVQSSYSPVPATTVSGFNNTIIGTKVVNISSADTTYLKYDSGTWRCDTEPGYYQAYSNDSTASVTFSFYGVAAVYTAERKADRGICQLTLDDNVPVYIDLYNDSNYTEGVEAIWASRTLVYGQHNVTISQIGPDARFGYYPYLVTENWLAVQPTDVSSYIQTQYIPTPTSRPSSSSSRSGPNTGAIVGGVIGAVVACALAGFIFYLWRREKARDRRTEGMPVQKVKKASGKMAIEDEPDSSSGGDHNPFGGAPGGAYPAYGAGYGEHYAPYGQYPYGGVPHTAYSASAAPMSDWGGSSAAYAQYHHPPSLQQPFLPQPPHSAGSADSQQPIHPPSSPGFPSRASYYDSAYHSGGASEGGQQPYPSHEQGVGGESRRYFVPEI
ncbi:hypothetical protein JCM10207_005178 [Rhodosporidiobolus poonsookiae]